MVVSLVNLTKKDMFAFLRTSTKKETTEKQIVLRNAWISYAMFLSKNKSVKEYSLEKLKESIPNIRKLIKQEQETFLPLLTEILSEVGIKFIYLPYLAGSNISGVTKWIANENAILIAVNDYGKDADKIWFSIFHELGHAVKNNKRNVVISSLDNEENIEENFADDFAKNSLIDPNLYEMFIKKNDFSISSINKFSIEIDLPTFMIIGRLQKDGYINWSEFNEYKIKYSFS